LATDRQTKKQMDSTDTLSRSRCRERRLNNYFAKSNTVSKVLFLAVNKLKVKVKGQKIAYNSCNDNNLRLSSLLCQ